MKEETLKELTDEVYQIGFKNGRIEMKNKILKTINRSFKLANIKTTSGLFVEVLKTIDKIK